MRPGLRQILLVLLAVIVAAGLVLRFRGAIGLEGFSWHRLAAAMRGTRPGPLLLSVAAIFAAYAVRALRWIRFSRTLPLAVEGSPSLVARVPLRRLSGLAVRQAGATDPRTGRVGAFRFARVYSATLMGFAAIFLLGRAGEPIRPLLIARKDKMPVAGTFGIYVLERIFDLASTLVIAALGLLVFSPVPGGEASKALLATARTTGFLLLAGLAGLAALLIYFRFRGARVLERRLEIWRTRRGWRRRAAGFFTGFGEGLQAIRTFGDFFAAVSYSAAHWLVVAAIYLWVPHGFGGRLGELDFPGALVVLAFTMAGSTLQLPGVGGGAQVASFIAFTAVFGVEKEPAAAASIVLWLVTFAASSLAGVPLLIREGWSMGGLRRLAQAEAEAEAAGTHVSVPNSGDSPGDARP